MIRYILLRNFQVHCRLRVLLDPCVTTILGPSDVGKSSIMRALKWLATNRPAGQAFIRDGERKVIVSVITDEGTVRRIKGTSVNEYRVNGCVLKAFGNDVPAEVLSVLNMSDINFQVQHEGPFWFSQTAGEVSRQLNQIVDLSIMDSTLGNLASALRRARAEEEVACARLKEARDKRKELRFVTVVDQSLAVVEQALKHWRITTDTKEQLKELIENIRALEEEASKPTPNIKPLEELGRVARASRKKSRALANAIHAITQLQEQVKRCKDQERRQAAELKNLIGKTCPLCGQGIK